MPVLISAKLDRTDSTTSWGFRLQGGKDFSAPLTIQRVTPGSLADKCGIQQGDVVVKISGQDSRNFKHNDAHTCIQHAYNSLELSLERGGGGGGSYQYTTPTYQPSQPSYQPSQPTYEPSHPTYQPASQPGLNKNFNPTPKPFGASPGVPVVMNKQYNTPINVYSVDNVMDSLAGQTRAMGISDHQPSGSPSNPSNGVTHESDSMPPTNSVTIPGYRKVTPPTQRACYEDCPDDKEITNKGYTNPNLQSKTFKTLQNMIDTSSEEELPTSFAPKVSASVDPVPDQTKQVVHAQYNSPMDLYSQQNIKTTHDVKAQDLPDQTDGHPTGMPGPGKRVFKLHESETYKLLKQEDRGSIKGPAEAQSAVPSQAFRTVEKQVQYEYQPSSQPQGGSAQQAAPFRPAQPPRGPAPAPQPVRTEMWRPSVPTGPRNPTFGKRGDARAMSGPQPGRIPRCNGCGVTIRGPFILALDSTWCPDHFVCANPNCRQSLVESGFVEEGGKLYCENDYAQHFAPSCSKCDQHIIGDCVNALQKTFHPHCFLCVHCRQPIGKGNFHMEDGQPYCDTDWQAMYQTKCYGCQFPVEPGDRWVEALNGNWHSECFNCSTCQVNLEGQPFYAKGGHPYCKRHASGLK